MNLVMNDAEEVFLKKDVRKKLGKPFFIMLLLLIFMVMFFLCVGRILLRGDNVTLIMLADST